MTDQNPDTDTRRTWMGTLAKARPSEIHDLVAALPDRPEFEWLRPPESGGVMVRGRTGGTGAPFNLGEMTVTRCALRLTSGEVGHAYVQGRDRRHAEEAALVDALMQGPRAEEVRAGVLGPLTEAREKTRRSRAAKADATRVDFFTLVRGED